MNINKKKEPMNIKEKSHENFMGGTSYELSPFVRLYVMSASSFFGEPAYYQNGADTGCSEDYDYLKSVLGSHDSRFSELSHMSRNTAMVKAIEDSLKYDAKLTLNYFKWLRNEGFIRTTPQVALAIAAHSPELKGTGLIQDIGTSLFARLDDAASCLAYYIQEFGKPIPNSLKKVLRQRLMNATEYELAKYKKEGHTVSMKDIIFLTHASSSAIDKLLKGELKQTEKGLETWEAIISTKGSSTETWSEAVGVMGHMALLRNLRNLERFEVPTSLYLDKLIAGADSGKQLPFRYYMAYNHVSSYKLKEALEACIDITVKNLPTLKGRSLVLVDNSGSAQDETVSNLSNARVADVGNLMGILTCIVSEDGELGIFGDKLKNVPISYNQGKHVLKMLNTVNDIGKEIGMSTENGIWLALDKIIKEKEPFDRIFIYSDMQAGHGGLYGLQDVSYPVYAGKSSCGEKHIDVPALLKEYREKVNPNCYVYSVQIGGYSDNIFPEFYPKSYILSGWNQDILRFATYMERNLEDVESVFRNKFGLTV